MRATVAVLALAVVALSGCTVQANPAIPASEVEALAAEALTEQWGAEPEIDCGEKNVDLVEGTTVDCTANNPNSGLDYPATVTITDVDGSKYSIDVVVGAAIADEEESTSDAPTVDAANLAGVAADALEGELGYRPGVDCGTEPIAIVLDDTIECVATGDDGVDYAAEILVTDVTDTGYDIDVTMGSTPVG